MDAENRRLDETRTGTAPWRKWGPYLSERQWGTVREDYSESGDAWNYFSHDHARSRAYRWGEDGLAGISDDRQLLCFALALWNGNDPILKERLFGLTNSEGNHGEDVKEYYFYLDSTPTHSYMKYLYKYPQSAYPYDKLVATNRRRSRHELEYELLDTGVFDQDRYFDVFVEYAKAAPEDILVQITVCNRGPEPATLHVLPTVWFRNVWSSAGRAPQARLQQVAAGAAGSVIAVSHPDLGERFLYSDGAAELLFTENETNTQRIVRVPNRTPYVKDGINDYIVHGRRNAVNPDRQGTKASAHYLAHRRGRGIPDPAPAAERRGARAARERCLRGLRRADGGAPAGGRRVLRLGHPCIAGCRRGQRDAPGDRRHAVVQAVLLLRCRHVAHGARRRPVQPEAESLPQRPLAPHAQRRHHLDARQVGIPLVRGLGPGLPRPRPEPGRRGFRQAPTGPDARGSVPPPERAAARLRVELRRRESPGACLGHDLHLPPRKGPPRRGRPRLARAVLSQAGAQLHLVGEPQGPRRQQRLRGWVPGAGQHRRLRPQRPAADRRVPGAGRRHRLDGPLLPEHDGDHRRAGDAPPGLRGDGSQVRPALSCGSPRR